MSKGSAAGWLTRFRAPNTIILILGLLCFFAALTWVIPGGAYERVEKEGREVVDPGSFERVESEPAGIIELLMAPINGFTDSFAILIITFIFIVAGAFSIIQKTGAFARGIQKAAILFNRNDFLRPFFIPVFIIIFSVMGSVFGMSEEVIIFIPLFVPLALALGYDSIVGVSVPFIGASAGFAGAVVNPFTVGVAQGLAEIPLLSGWEFRILLWLATTAVAIWIVSSYGWRIHRDPAKSPVYELDKSRDEELTANEEDNEPFTWNQLSILIVFAAGIVLLIYGATSLDWYIAEMAALFFALGVISAVLGGLSGNEAANAFIEGMKDVLGAVVVIALSRSILLLITDAQIIDTILYGMSNAIAGWHPVVSAEIMLIVQSVINFVVPSGSGQAALTIPIMAPLGDLVGVTRQTVVLVFQMGDGITNMIIPTSGVTMAVLGMAKVPWSTWAAWLAPRLLWFYLVAVIAIAIAVFTGYS
ncbi:YfcC family protein [Natronogracilivirga saccharolytica]|uniref:Putative basic amino acid antiporter YfcC n=1 Tax=Natronogracilivirga saccharolytica TaxID=2812953 RepID=A0A8J7RN45_9BACT|nr:YfcC family protein [Natronogracilivirga saccharolytica]MBP3192784.1 putative basic amino acid antiporter YfcC [Natronogracilivirga saccharolytica]